MIKKLLVLASSIVALTAGSSASFAQVKYDIFNMPDTVCTDHEIEPYDIVEGANTYNWSFCPPDLTAFPTGGNKGNFPYLHTPAAFRLVRDGNNLMGFYINNDGTVYKVRYEDGVTGSPSHAKDMGRISTVGRGVYPVHSGTKWHVFAIGGNAWNNSNLVRYDFDNGLMQNATQVTNFNNFDSLLVGTNQFVVALDNDNNWYGFTINSNAELIRFEFGTNLESKPYITNLGTLHNNLINVTSFELIKELDNWHLYITNKESSSVKRISFGNSFLNPIYVIDYGNLGDQVARPVGISITKDCDKYYGWVLSEGNSNLVGLVWENSIADTPTATNLGNFVGIQQAQTLTNIIREKGGVYMLSTNNFDQSISLIEYLPCSYATPAFKDQRLPPTFKYSEPGIYSVMLTVNEGLPTVTTECQNVYVYPHPEIIVSNNDTVVCQNDTIRTQILIFDIDSIIWTPNYNISSTYGQTVHMWPQQETEYKYTIYFDRDCVVRKPLNVTVSKIGADAGPDRTINDGATTALGGPNTTIIDGYHYQWTPTIGITGSEWSPITTTKPPYSITYYLEVSNDLGCKATDSVSIYIPCEKAALPNAFMPNSDNGTINTFKPLNSQFSKINSFKVYDRWGKAVFETNNPDEGWDGAINGVPAPFGVYVWELDANCANTFERIIETGNVTLVR
jgi:gliding motility-associated-like protein